MYVVDSSAMIEALAPERPRAELRERLEGSELHAPHLIDLEVTNALRRLRRGRSLSPHRAANALADFVELEIIRYPHLGLLERIWELAPNLTAYDAAYVALSEALGHPLLTADARLARSSGHEARIELL